MTQDGFELVVLLLLLWTVGVISIGCHIQLSLSMYIKKILMESNLSIFYYAGLCCHIQEIIVKSSIVKL